MYKWHKLGVRGKIWKIINDFHVNTKSAVVVNQTQSSFFPVQEGVRQGGVLSGLLYLVFIDQLLFEIETCNKKTGILNINSCCPCLADDVSCIATTPTGLQRMLDVCTNYAYKWRFNFNANKSHVMQFYINSREANIQHCWYISNELVPTTDTHSHLGIEMNSNLRYSERIENLCRKGKNTFFAARAIYTKDTNPCVSLHIYKTVVLPTVFYGCEVWSNLKNSDISILDKFQHFIVKYILNLKVTTRSDMCQSLLGLHPILTYIDKRKLSFLQKLCNMEDEQCRTRFS